MREITTEIRKLLELIMHVKICMLQLKKYWEGNIYIYETFYIWNAILENKKSLKWMVWISNSKEKGKGVN